jgi:hypothetical protein
MPATNVVKERSRAQAERQNDRHGRPLTEMITRLAQDQ